jgi:serine phosphatase RsbU (regulator of sigma subunit)
MGKLSAVLLVVALWRPGVLFVPGVYYGVRLARLATRRLLYSVRAKLAAFYLYAALLPVLLFAIVLLFILYVGLGQVSARRVEARLENLVEWAEERARLLENGYWSARAGGAAAPAALERALAGAYGDVASGDFACWATDGAGALLAARGPVHRSSLAVPVWLGDRRFVGVAVDDSSRMTLRTRVRLVDSGGPFEVGAVLPIDSKLVNHGLAGAPTDLRGGLGAPDRDLVASVALSDSAIRRRGIIGSLFGDADMIVSPTQVRFETRDGRPDSLRGGGWATRLDVPSPREQAAARALSDSLLREAPGIGLDSLRLRSRFPLLHWMYVGYPVEWGTGRHDNQGPPILTTFTVEGAVRELLPTGVGVSQFVLVGVAIVVGFLLLLLLVASLRGVLYARAISHSVAKLDRGVHAIQVGDFGYRVAPRERDQLGALALAFNDMAGRLQGLLEERANLQAVERELAIARDVQARLFPEHTPYAPFLEAAGVCLPARTVSGDYYDYIEGTGGFDAVVADVSGKGISAALLMASLHSALRSLYLKTERAATSDLGEVVTRLNQHLHQYIEPTRFVTLFLARYRGDGRLLYCNAGHNPAALVRDGRVEWLSQGGLMLGPFPDLVYEPAAVSVQPGDVVCIYTDGVTEAEGPNGEQFGEERLAAVLREAHAARPREVLAAIQDRLRAWRGEREPGDDVTLVVLRVTA